MPPGATRSSLCFVRRLEHIVEDEGRADGSKACLEVYNTAGSATLATSMPSCSATNWLSLSSTTFYIGPAPTFTDHFVPTGSASSFIRGMVQVSHASHSCPHFSALNV